MPVIRRGLWPKVSVVMSTYKRPKMLKRAVQAVLDQDYDDFELIIVDDGSDTAKDAVEDFDPLFVERGIRMLVIALEDNSGYQSRPKNIGIAYSRGTYIAHADDDDIWYPYHLSTLVEEIEKGGCDLVYGTWDFGGDREGETWEFIPFNHLTVNLMMTAPHLGFVSCCSLYSKSAAMAVLGGKLWNEDLRRFGDWELYYRMVSAGLRFRGIPKATFKYMWHGENLQLVRPVNEETANITLKGADAQWHKEAVLM